MITETSETEGSGLTGTDQQRAVGALTVPPPWHLAGSSPTGVRARSPATTSWHASPSPSPSPSPSTAWAHHAIYFDDGVGDSFIRSGRRAARAHQPVLDARRARPHSGFRSLAAASPKPPRPAVRPSRSSRCRRTPARLQRRNALRRGVCAARHARDSARCPGAPRAGCFDEY